jgi:hypothetical protein
MRALHAIALAGILAACSQPEPVPSPYPIPPFIMPVHYDGGETGPASLKIGHPIARDDPGRLPDDSLVSVHGRVIGMLQDGKMRQCGKEHVFLLEDTARNENLMQAKGGTIWLDPKDLDPVSSCDAAGDFKFVDVPARRWWLVTDLVQPASESPTGQTECWAIRQLIDLHTGDNPINLTAPNPTGCDKLPISTMLWNLRNMRFFKADRTPAGSATP